MASPRAARRDVADDRPDFKKSRIPLALRSPKPIRRELQQPRGLFSSATAAPTAAPPDVLAASAVSTTATQDTEETNGERSVVEVKAGEIVKRTVSPGKKPTEDIGKTPKDQSAEKTSDTEAEEFVPQNTEAMETVEETEGEVQTGALPTAYLGSEPQTFVVEVKRLEMRMEPTVGVITRRQPSEEPHPPSPHAEVIYCEVEDLPQVKGSSS